MNLHPTWEAWGALAARLALASVSLMAIASLLHWRLKAPVWRRTVWRAVLLGMLILCGAEFVGLSAWFLPQKGPISLAVEPGPMTHASTLPGLPGAMPAPAPTAGAEATSSLTDVGMVHLPEPGWWPGVIWAAGFFVLLGRQAFSRIHFQIRVRREKPMAVGSSEAVVRDLERRMGVASPVRLVRIPGLSSPAAFCWWRPVVGIPKGFEDQFSPEEQAAMLAHELAHVKAGDGLWQWVGAMTVAVWWWFPLVWRAHHQWLLASEMAADEGCTVLEHGLEALASGLVVLGRQLSRELRWTGMAAGGHGLRTSMGRRVERLLKHPGSTQANPILLRVFLPVQLGLFLSFAWLAVYAAASQLHALEPAPCTLWYPASHTAADGWQVAAIGPVSKIHPAPSPEPIANVNPVPSVEGRKPSVTNTASAAQPAAIQLTAMFLEIPTAVFDDLPCFQTNSASSFVLSADSTAALVKTIRNQRGADLVTSPPLSITSGKQSQFAVSQQRTAFFPKNGLWFTNAPKNWVSTVEIVMGPQAGNTNIITMKFQTGSFLDCWTEVKPDQTIQVALNFSLTNFCGYGPPELVAKWQPAWVNELAKQPSTPLPRFRISHLTGQGSVRIGETLVIGPYGHSQILKTRNAIPVVSDIPWIGQLFRSESTLTNTIKGYVLVTPEIH
jgi:beta-lactamase regulating signal transducer with metallopeptidase domain